MKFTTKTKEIDFKKIRGELPNCTIETEGNEITIYTDEDLDLNTAKKTKLETIIGKALKRG